MTNEEIKKLVKLTLKEKSVDQELAGFVLNKLSRKELITYLRLVRAAVDRNTVKIVSNETISQKLRSQIESKFQDKVVIFEQNKSIGPGIQAIFNDSVIDLTFEGFLNQTVTSLKSSL
jgi:hypothetical protein